MDNLIIGATLLSVDEVKQVPEDIREFESWWWLRSPGLTTHFAASVLSLGCVCVRGYDVDDDDFSVRPALQLNLESSNPISDGTKLRIGKYDFTVVCNEAYALCNTSIGKSVFRQNWETKDANIYERSDIKKIVDNWFKDEIIGKEITIMSETKIGIA